MSPIKCNFCFGNHSCRNCTIEKQLAPVIKKMIGNKIEEFIGEYIPCPCCKKNNLNVLGNNSPSLDIICSSCKKNYEVKSKCLSIKILPKDLMLPHGNYFDFLRRREDQLDFLLVIYGVDRRNKKVMVKKILHIPHKLINSDQNCNIVKNETDNKSTIYIKNQYNYTNIISNKQYNISFQKEINPYINLIKAK